jgi:hypothetical protein
MYCNGLLPSRHHLLRLLEKNWKKYHIHSTHFNKIVVFEKILTVHFTRHNVLTMNY